MRLALIFTGTLAGVIAFCVVFTVCMKYLGKAIDRMTEWLRGKGVSRNLADMAPMILFVGIIIATEVTLMFAALKPGAK